MVTFLCLNVVANEHFGEEKMKIVEEQKNADGRYRVNEAQSDA